MVACFDFFLLQKLRKLKSLFIELNKVVIEGPDLLVSVQNLYEVKLALKKNIHYCINSSVNLNYRAVCSYHMSLKTKTNLC